MTRTKTSLYLAAVTTATLAISACAAPNDRTGHQLAAQDRPMHATAGATGMGMGMGTYSGATTPAYANQMRAMQGMHDQMLAARTPAQREALMDEHMSLMQSGMRMMHGMGTGMGTGMGHMGGGAMTGKPGDPAAQQAMLEQRIAMMQSMLQMMVDRNPSAPAVK